MKHALRFVLLGGLCASLAAGPRVHAGPAEFQAQAAFALTASLEFELAHKALAIGDSSDPKLQTERARLAIYEDQCDAAQATLQSLPKSDESAELLEIARGCARATSAAVRVEVPSQDLVVTFQDEHDQAMLPLIAATVAAARPSITTALGVDWPRPTRITVVRDQWSLSAMTGLPFSAASTTGTVAVAKWGRVTMLSPRAMVHGYNYRDTLAHELTHLAVTRRTRDRAPLWLQEGMAKREETQWRSPSPFDHRPNADLTALAGIRSGKAYALDKLGPSLAMLPSADLAAIAYAEVASFVSYLWATLPPATREEFLDSLKNDLDATTALKRATGADLAAWDGRWRTQLLAAEGGRASTAKPLPVARQRVRLAELLLGRAHPAQAREQLARAGAGAARDAHVATLQAWSQISTPLAPEAAAKLFTELRAPAHYQAEWSRYWSLRGLLAGSTDDAARNESLLASLGISPFDAIGACRSIDAWRRVDAAGSGAATTSAPLTFSGQPLVWSTQLPAMPLDEAALCSAAQLYPIPPIGSE